MSRDSGYALGPVAPGSTLVVGARYRIMELSEADKSPRHRVGEIVLCGDQEDGDTLRPDWRARYWFIARGMTGTYVTGLERIA